MVNGTSAELQSIDQSTKVANHSFTRRQRYRRAIRNTGTMAGLKPHVPAIYRVAATGLSASMWFFLMYRAKKDGPVVMGWKHPWDH